MTVRAPTKDFRSYQVGLGCEVRNLGRDMLIGVRRNRLEAKS